jgi:hypothetical protein
MEPWTMTTTHVAQTVVEQAVAAVRDQFAGHPVHTVSDGVGGVFVTIGDIDLGPAYTPGLTWLGFHINTAYPHSDVYPHYIGRVTRVDNQAHGVAVQLVDWQNRPALQLSRRSNRWNPATDTAALKVEKVITWFRAQ